MQTGKGDSEARSDLRSDQDRTIGLQKSERQESLARPRRAGVSTGGRNPEPRAPGFTLLELMIVLALLLILASLATPAYEAAVRRAREAVLRDDLYTMRKLIDEFTLDKQRPPQSLDELVDEHYLRGGIPVDPMTQSNQTWRVDFEDVPITPQQSIPGVVDVHSGSDDISSDGTTAYSSW